jgi:hypothetical protein
VYENGLQFRTPEAITAVGTFRASHYLRAIAIWGIYGVLSELGIVSRKDAKAQRNVYLTKNLFNKNKINKLT